MKRLCLVLALAAAATTAEAGFTWADLWQTPDQQGQQLLRQGQAASAAQTFSEPRHKAYAELQAGDYPAAARDLVRFDDSDADYNRGNALAHTGDLEGAIKAYDAAIAHDPKNTDARHNRDLVQKALDQQKQQKDQDQQKNSSGKGQQQPGKNGQQGKDQNGSGQAQQGQSQQGQGKQGQGKPGGQSASQGQQPQNGQNPAQQNANAQAGQGKPAGQSQSTAQGATASAATSGSQAAAAQARRDAEASLKQGADKGTAGTMEMNAGSASSGPPSEQQMAEQQWLRSIPDDPAGLLRRKFMIEHMLRQQEQQAPQ